MRDSYFDLHDDAQELLRRAQELDGTNVPFSSVLKSLTDTSIRLAMIMLELEISQPPLDPERLRDLAEELQQAGFVENMANWQVERVAWQKEAHCLLSRLVGTQMKYKLGDEIEAARSWW